MMQMLHKYLLLCGKFKFVFWSYLNFFFNIFFPWLVEPVAAKPPNLESHMPTIPNLVFLPGKFHGQRRQWATIPGVSKSQTRLSN